MAEYVTLTRWAGGEQRLGRNESMEVRFSPLEPGAITISTIGYGPRRRGDPEGEPEESTLSCRMNLLRPGDPVPVATALGGRPTHRPLRYDATEQDLALAGDWICRVTNPNEQRGTFVTSVALPYRVELWTATLDLSLVNQLIARALQVTLLQVHLETHPTQARSWISYSRLVAAQFGLPQRVSFQLEPFPFELPVIHETVNVSLSDLNSRVLSVVDFVGRDGGELRLLVSIGFETNGRELTTSIGLSHDIKSLSVAVEFRLDGSSPVVTCSLSPAEIEILGWSVNVRDKVREALVSRLANARLRASVSRYLNDFLTHLLRLGDGARIHQIRVQGGRIVFKYYNEMPEPRRPLAPVERKEGRPGPSPIRARTVLDGGGGHTIGVPLELPGLVTVVSRLTRRPTRPEIDPESGEPIPLPSQVPQTVRLVRHGRGGTEVAAEVGGDAITVLNRMVSDEENRDATWSVVVVNTGEFAVNADVTVAHPTVPGNLGKIDHLVVVMMENRSFDHMLGHLSLDGRTDVDGLRGNETNSFDEETFPVFPLASTEFCGDPGHDGTDVDAQIADRMQGFVRNFAAHPKRGREQPGAVMGFYAAEQLRAYGLLAREFAVCDRWFSSVPGYTWPNRLYSLTGTSDGARDGAPIDFDDPPVFDFTSIFEVLHHYGVSWTYFFHDVPFPVLLRRFVQDASFGQGLAPFREFVDQARRGDLPAVSWVEPPFLNFDPAGPGADDHPPGDVVAGQRFVASV